VASARGPSRLSRPPARLDGRSIDEGVTVQVDAANSLRFVGPTMMREGEYRAIRLTSGIRF